MRAHDIMTRNVISLSPDATIQEAARLLADKHISGAPVLDEEGRLCGILSEGDLLHRTELGTTHKRRAGWLEWPASNRARATTYIKENARLVRDVMSTEVVSVSETTPLREIADLMERRGIKRVPVVYEGEVLGIVSRANLIRALAIGAQSASEDAALGDRRIREAVLHELGRHSWAAPVEDLTVQGGVVHLWGFVTSAQQARAMCIVAEGVAGVKSVEDHTTSAFVALHL
jgi:CBS domain-containing protein